MKIKLFNKSIRLPVKSHLPDVGLDFFLPQDICIEPHSVITIGLGFGVQIPEGFAGLFVPRSSIAARGLIIQTSIIDPDYTGEVHLIAQNGTDTTLSFKKGDRLGSLVVLSVLNARIEVVDEFEHTERGENGLGSTGK